MVIKNATVLTDSFVFEKQDVLIENDKIIDIGFDLHGEDIVDGKDSYLVAGFVDIHTHGCVGFDACDANYDGYKKMAEFYASKGVTSFLFTTMTLPKHELINILSLINKYMKSSHSGCAIPQGVYLEGPFISPTKKGAQDDSHIKKPDIELFEQLDIASGNNIAVVTVAPEVDGSDDFIKYISNKCKVSIAHTDADYETSIKAIGNGASNITHLFNAMPPFLHRKSGVVGAGFDSENVTLELICDGIHLEPSVIRTAFKVAADRVVLISDSMMAAGLSDGEYSLGG
ncbi:MAG: N-acetylglucosamine-6-phosphate deacetylase, partial [Oscillospiraceae bacterium]